MFTESKYWELQRQIDSLKKDLERKEYWSNKTTEKVEAILSYLNLEVTEKQLVLRKKEDKKG